MGNPEPWDLALVSRTADPIVETPDLKTYLRVLHDKEDQLIEDLRDAATRRVEGLLGRAGPKSTWRITFPEGVPVQATLELPRPPFDAVSSIEEWDEDTAAWDTVAAADYQVRDTDPVARVEPASETEWPTDELRVTYTAGYASADDAAKDLQLAIQDLVAYWYENRGNLGDVPSGFLERHGHLKVYWR